MVQEEFCIGKAWHILSHKYYVCLHMGCGISHILQSCIYLHVCIQLLVWHCERGTARTDGRFRHPSGFLSISIWPDANISLVGGNIISLDQPRGISDVYATSRTEISSLGNHYDVLSSQLSDDLYEIFRILLYIPPSLPSLSRQDACIIDSSRSCFYYRAPKHIITNAAYIVYLGV